MMRSTKLFFVASVVCSFFLIVVHSHVVHHHHQPRAGIVKFGKNEKIAVGLARVFGYILENHKSISLDGLFGVVFAQAHLNAILKMGLQSKDRASIQRLKGMADFIYAIVKPLLYKGDKKQILFVEEILDPHLWHIIIDFEKGHLNASPPVLSNSVGSNLDTFDGYLAYLSSSNMSEIQSDQCLLELIESGSRTYFHECHLSDDCRRYMVDDPNYDPTYGITHRLLYLQIGRGRKCAMNPEWYRAQTRSYCSYILWEASRNAHFGFLEELDDILLEQITLCGFEGFAEFLGSEFIDHVLDIQTEHGCFGIPALSTSPSTDGNGQKSRQRRSANLISYGCNDHTTGLGASALALMLRYLMGK